MSQSQEQTLFNSLPLWGTKVCLRRTYVKNSSFTGVFPINKTKFDKSRLSRSKVEAYNRLICAGRSENEVAIPIVPPAQEEDTDGHHAQ